MIAPVFEKYEIVRRLAIGGMGEIFLARQSGISGFDRLVILKSLLPELAAQDGSIDQFLDEARVAATLNHPNIVQIFEVGHWQGVYFIAMEFIRGENVGNLLSACIKNRRYLPPHVAAKVVHDAALGLDHAHRARDVSGNPLNLVHRDISPQNIMVRDDGVTKVVDFGIAKAANRETRTATGALKGKLHYMPPEQLAGHPLDGRSDQYSLGVVFWEMCARRRLYGGDNTMETIKQIATEAVKPLCEVVGDGFPPMLDAIVLKMQEKNPADRYETCRQVGAELRKFLDTCEHETSETQVSEVVREVCGDHIDSIVNDLTPSGENFLIDLSEKGKETRQSLGSGELTEAATVVDLSVRRRRVVLRLGLLAIVAGLAATWFAVAGRHYFATPKPAVVAPVAVATGADQEKPPPPAKPATLRVTTKPPGAAVVAGTMLLGTTPVTVTTLLPGVEHQLTVAKRGYQNAELTILLKSGEAAEKTLVLTRHSKRRGKKPVATTVPAKVDEIGTLTIRTDPWTRVSLDGAPHGTTPLFMVKLKPGKHRLKLVNKEEGINVTRTIDIKPGKNTKLDLNLAN